MSLDIYTKYCNGDHITDEELPVAIKDYVNAYEALMKLGPCFEVSRKEIARVFQWLDDVQIARKGK